MSIIEKVMKVFFGDKSAKDIKLIQPLIDKALSYGTEYQGLTNDQLRGKTLEFKQRIHDAIAAKEAEIAELEAKADAENNKAVDVPAGGLEMSPEEKATYQKEEKERLEKLEKLFNQIDTLKKEVYDITEGVLADVLPEAFAVVKETARRFAQNPTLEVTATAFDRELSATHPNVVIEGEKALWANTWDAAGKPVTWDMIHYDVQLIGGVVLHQGKIAEMATGEGKTLVATLPIYLNALPGKGVHVVTVNNYLARRDAAWMGPLYQFHGLSVDCVDNTQPNSPERKKAYLADITYGTNAEFGFDYLRDNGAREAGELVQREHNYAIVDEVDSVLIDDARTPLIISGPIVGGDNRQEFLDLRPQVEQIVAEQKRFIQKEFVEAKRLISEGDTSYTDDGEGGGAKLYRVFRGAPKTTALIKYLSESDNKLLLHNAEKVYMEMGNRLMPKIDRDLFFTIDERLNTIQLTDKGVAFLSKYNNDDTYFIMPDLGVSIDEIEKSHRTDEEKAQAKEELYRDFSIKSQRLHTMTQLLKAYMLFEKDVEYVIMDGAVKIVDEQTGRIMEGRRYSDGLHQAIEAKENVKIEDATQTYTTVTLQNYFRMYHKLAGMTGTAITEANEFWEIYKLDVVEIPTNRPIARIDREDLLYKTKREKYNAIIEEITNLSKQGRPVLVGTTSVEVSELISRQLNLRKIQHSVLNAKMHMREAEIVAEAGRKGVVTIATNMAGRGTDIKLTQEVKDLGGLAIIGTERHDSRRVDRQLRGRAGRQGDPGTSQFYISLEDNLMRLFASEKLGKLMTFLGLKEGDVIQDKRITNMVEKAQRRVEENHFGSRKNTLEYDNVMNSQRTVVYKRRFHALFGERLSVDIANMMSDVCYVVVNEEKNEEGSYASFARRVQELFALPCPFTEQEYTEKKAEDLSIELYDVVYSTFKEKMEKVVAAVYPFIKSVYETPSNRYKMIGVPFSDGIKTLHMGVDLEKAYNTKGHQVLVDLQKNIVLSITDDAWKQHLRDMDDLRETVRNAVYEQKDPVLIYKFEAYELFQAMIKKVNAQVISFLLKGQLPTQDPNHVEQVRHQKRVQGKESRGADEAASQGVPSQQAEPERPRTFVRDQPKYGRNDRVRVQDIATGEVKEMKYKQAEPMVEGGKYIVLGKAE
ncbi:MAG: preprotein translocase subunit SecA [Flavobacteriales bacterium]|nr:preprotein translocase subunit SecA [Flavobacteriales bacterium]